ncbi:MAG: hypothetical protein ACKVU0_15470 [Saprospiraceae bacterium]
MKNISIFIFGLFVFAAACTDPDLDPLQFDKIKKGSLITLRSTAIVNDPANRGAMDTFSISGNVADYSLDFDTDYLSDDINSLSEVQIYASLTDGAGRVRVGTVPGSAFSLAAGTGTYPRATVNIPMSDILSPLGKNMSDFVVNQYIFIECDLTLNDGSTVPASAFTNLSLYESILFLPAHKMRMIAKP